MNIELQRASLSEKVILRNLLELCQHDYSEFDHMDVDEHGLYGYKWLDHCWTEPERHPFLVRVDGKLAGFVLIRAIHSQGEPVIHAIAEFFVMRKYRRQGIGRQIAYSIFDMFPGQWSIDQEQGNLLAQKFWREVIAEYTQGKYTEEYLQTEEWRGSRQKFQSNMS